MKQANTLKKIILVSSMSTVFISSVIFAKTSDDELKNIITNGHPLITEVVDNSIANDNDIIIRGYNLCDVDKSEHYVTVGDPNTPILLDIYACNFQSIDGALDEIYTNVSGIENGSHLMLINNGKHQDSFAFSYKENVEPIPGPQGERGLQGIKGDTGANGVSGIQGPKGDIGLTGGQGEKGDTGAIGAIGIQGPKGDIGLTGAKGYTGEKGDTGVIGATGLQGLKGEIGLTGAQGETGAIGATGVQGPKGDIGLTGAKGVKGDTGVAGEQGKQGSQGYTGPQGQKGDTGIQGLKGDKGDSGAGFAGFRVFAVERVGNIAANTNDYQTANCPQGSLVVGGGFHFPGDGNLFRVILSQANNSLNGWGVSMRNVTGSTLQAHITAQCLEVIK